MTAREWVVVESGFPGATYGRAIGTVTGADTREAHQALVAAQAGGQLLAGIAVLTPAEFRLMQRAAAKRRLPKPARNSWAPKKPR